MNAVFIGQGSFPAGCLVGMVGLEMSDSRTPEEVLLPWSAVACLCYSLVAAVSVAAALLSGSVGPKWERPDPQELWHARAAILLVFSGVVMEMCFLVSSSMSMKLMGSGVSSKLRLHGVGDSLLTLTEYSLKIFTGMYTWWRSGALIHVDTLAIGGPRPVYFTRFAQWSVEVPILVLIGNRAFLNNCSTREMLVRSGPSLLATFLYVWASWLMEVTPSVSVRWPMLFLSLSGFVFVGIDQIVLACHHRHEDNFNLKLGMIIYQLSTFTIYSIVFLLGRFGTLNSFQEQCFYAYGDATLKTFQGAILAMIRNREDLGVIHSWWLATVVATEDLDNLVRRALVPVFSLDLQGRISAWNDSMEKLTGLALKEVHGRPLKEVACPESREGLQAAIDEVLATGVVAGRALGGAGDGKGCEGEVALGVPVVDACAVASRPFASLVEISIPISSGTAAKGPATRQLAMSLVPKSTGTGQLAGIMAIGQDLSEVAELKITQEKKTALMALLSHEIRSPLHGIMGLTMALMSTEAGKSMERQLGMVKGCAARLLDLVTNVMDLAQHEKRKRDGRPAPRPTAPVNFAAIVDEVITLMSMAVDKMNTPLLRPSVRLINNVANMQVALIPGDPHKCTQLVYNLVTNACKFTERGFVSISVRHLPEAKRLEIDVADSGSGISEEGLKRIFQPFEQEQHGDRRSFQGIGLGLAVCQDIAELHGGEIRVRSQVGHGSTFTISLFCDGTLGFGQPCSGCNTSVPVQGPGQTVDSSPARAAIQPPQEVAAVDSNMPFVLSVDDDEVNQEVIRNALSDVCTIVCAMDGKQAIKCMKDCVQAKQRLPDVVLLDIQMPGMSGFEVCEEIRKSFECCHHKLPIIMVSARSPTDQTAIESFDKGATDFLSKPFNVEVLKRKVQVALQLKQQCGGSSITPSVAEEASERVRAAGAQAILAEEKAELAERKSLLAERKSQELQEHLEHVQRQLEEALARQAILPVEPISQPLPVTAVVAQPRGHAGGRFHKAAVPLARHLVGTGAVVRILVSRLEILNRIARECRGLLAMPASQAFLQEKPDYDDDEQWEENAGLGGHLKGYTALAKVIKSQLEMMEQVSAQSCDLAKLTRI